VDTHALRGYGICQDEVYPAVQALTDVEPVMMNFLKESKVNADLEQLFDIMSGVRPASVQSCTELYFRSSKRCSQYQEGGSIVHNKLAGASPNLIMIDHADGEAISVSRLFHSVFSQAGNWIEDQDLAPSDFATIVRGGKPGNAVFIFSQNSHKSPSQLARLGLLHRCQPEMHMVPVVVGVSFDFPDADYLQQLELGMVLNLGNQAVERLSSFAGDEVVLRHVSSGLSYLMGFLVDFINVPALRQSALNKALLDILVRATGSGRRTSLSGQDPIASPSPSAEKSGGGGGFGGGGGSGVIGMQVVESNQPVETEVTEV